MAPTGLTPVVWTPTYLDASKLGFVTTAATPVYSAGELVGVAGVDITIADLMADATNQFPAGSLSYLFVLNDHGEVISHPSLPLALGQSDNSTGTVSPDITQLERGLPAITQLRQWMMEGASGSYRAVVTRAFPRGNNQYDVRERLPLASHRFKFLLHSTRYCRCNCWCMSRACTTGSSTLRFCIDQLGMRHSLWPLYSRTTTRCNRDFLHQE
jgi:hypothetical protein